MKCINDLSFTLHKNNYTYYFFQAFGGWIIQVYLYNDGIINNQLTPLYELFWDTEYTENDFNLIDDLCGRFDLYYEDEYIDGKKIDIEVQLLESGNWAVKTEDDVVSFLMEIRR